MISNDFDGSTLASRSLAALKRLNQSLVRRGDNLVHGKLYLADKVVASVVSQIALIIDIVDDDSVVFSLLKVILDLETFDPLGSQAVPDDLSLAELSPHVSVKVGVRAA